MYRLKFSDYANDSIKKLNRKTPDANKKLAKLLIELQEHPRTGTGQVEQLKHFKEETWSRRITKEHRLVYRIYDDVVEVLVVSAYGHYE